MRPRTMRIRVYASKTFAPVLEICGKTPRSYANRPGEFEVGARAAGCGNTGRVSRGWQYCATVQTITIAALSAHVPCMLGNCARCWS